MKLPEPAGSVPLRIAGGARDATFLRPASVAVRVNVAGGVSDLSLDEHHLGASSSQTRLQSDGYPTAESRYEIDISGGVNQVSVRKS